MRGRPVKPRMMTREPEIRQFSPRGRRGRPGYINLKYEGYEAIRLYDYMELDQKEASSRMRVSQQTFSRILRKARKDLAKALINGDIIKISGGNFRISK
jgi:predicted DNA-binding protein (UPF0251 family)